MKSKRTILFQIGAIAVLLVIAGIMLFIGRGHTVYMDNKKLEYNGQTYDTPYKVVVTVDGEEVAKLRDKERGMATCIGQKFNMVLEITQEKGGEESIVNVSLDLPYGMDGVAINLPGYLAGLPAEAYLSEFIPAPEPEEEETGESEDGDIMNDEFNLEGIEGDV